MGSTWGSIYYEKIEDHIGLVMLIDWLLFWHVWWLRLGSTIDWIHLQAAAIVGCMRSANIFPKYVTVGYESSSTLNQKICRLRWSKKLYYYSLPTTHHLLLTTYYLLPTK